MATKVPIEIFFIGKTVADRTEMDKWLKFKGVEDFKFPDEETVTDRALVVGMAAKRCYMAFDTTQNPNLTRVRTDWAEYFDNILKVGHGCYDDATDVLTSLGWKAWPDVTKDDLLATLDLNGTLIYVKPVSVKSFDYSGKMYRVESDAVDLLVTPNHKLYVCKTTTKEGRSKKSYSLIEAEVLGHVSHAYTKVADSWEVCHSFYSVDVLKLLGFAIGDGNYETGKRVRFRLRRERKIVWLNNLISVLHDADPNWAINFDGVDRYSVTVPTNLIKLFQQIYDENDEKCIPSHVLLESDRAGLEGLLEGLMQSDGHCGKTGDSFDTTSSTLVGQFQQLCLHVGLAANICYTLDKEQRSTSFGAKPLTRLSVIRRALKPVVNKYVDGVGKSFWVNDWTGEVFCAQMPDTTKHVLYVRRNGIPVWCGNSVLEHSTYSFAIENVSRVFTGEMNRHRAGWAISEGSMRFIRFSEAVPYWEPTSIQGPDVLTPIDIDSVREQLECPEVPGLVSFEDLHSDDDGEPVDLTLDEKKHATRVIFEYAFDRQRDIYKLLEDLWKDELAPDSKFKSKKEITSLMRRIIGMGCATGGVWTGNIRALRHVLTMRCEPVAEEEILHVFSRVAMKIKEQEPMLFGDFYQDENGFWRPKYKKV